MFRVQPEGRKGSDGAPFFGESVCVGPCGMQSCQVPTGRNGAGARRRVTVGAGAAAEEVAALMAELRGQGGLP